MATRVAVYTGVFDPVHLGHLDVIRRGCRLVDRLVVGVGENPEKTSFFSRDERVELLKRVVTPFTNVEVKPFGGLAVKFVHDCGARIMLRGLRTTSDGVDGLLRDLAGVRIAFDATSAHSHHENSRKLTERGVVMIDLTPAAIGPYCVPPVNLLDHVGRRAQNVNMVSCGGQATIPMVAAVSRVQPVDYAEIVCTVASRSIGPGTRQNIDEFTRTTTRAIENGVSKCTRW